MIKKFADGSTLDTDTGVVTSGGKTYNPVATLSDLPNSLTSESLKPVDQIKLPEPQPDTTNYKGIVDAGSTTADSIANYFKSLTVKPEATGLDGLLASLGDAPPSGASAYESIYGTGPTQEEITAKNEKVIADQQEFDLLNAQMKALSAEAKAAPIKVQQEFEGRGVTKGGIQPIETSRLRDIALRSLPLEGELLASQAKLTGSQRALELAQSKFDKVFELRMSDISNQYNYKKSQQDKIWDYLTNKEKEQLAKIQNEDDRKYDEQKTNSALAQDWVAEAMKVGAADIASKISLLDPKDLNFTSRLADLQSQIINKQTQLKAQSADDELAADGYNYVATPKERDRLKSLGYDILVQSGRTYAKAPEPVKVTGGGGGGKPIPTTGQVSPQTQSVIDNPSLFDDLTPTLKGQIVGELQANGYDTTNLGVKGLSDSAMAKISDTQKALYDLNDLRTIINTNQDKIGPITGLAALNPWSKSKKIQADIDRVKQTVGKALEGGVLRKEDEEKYKKILATLTDTPETALYKVDSIITSIQRDIETYKSLQEASGRSLNVKSSLQKKGTEATPEDLRKKYNY
jgi:hypothetical protein